VLVPLLSVLALSLPVARSALHANEIWQEKAYLPGMAAIAAGVIGALIARRARPGRAASNMVGAAGVLGLGMVLVSEDLLWPILGNGTMLVLVMSAVCIVVSCTWREAVRPGPAGCAPAGA
jgi:hypothetical protein